MQVTGGSGHHDLDRDARLPQHAVSRRTPTGHVVQNLNGWVPGPTYCRSVGPGWAERHRTCWLERQPTPTVPLAYSIGSGRYTLDSKLDQYKSISCIWRFAGTNLATPIRMAQWYLDNYGRPGVAQGIMLETDGHPQWLQVPAGSTTNAFTCQDANDAATAAKADGIQILPSAMAPIALVRRHRSTRTRTQPGRASRLQHC